MLSQCVLVGLRLVWPLVGSRGTAEPEQKADFAQLKANLLDYLTGAGADREDPQVRASLRAIGERARDALCSARPDGSWADISITEEPGREFRIARHVSRVATMAEAFRAPGQALFDNAELAAAVERGLSHINQLVGRSWPTSGGWWQQQIAVPRSLGATLLLMDGRLAPAVVAETVQTMRYFLMEEAPFGQNVIWHLTLLPRDAPAGESHQATGENMVWLALNHLYLALVTNDPEKAAHARAGIVGECATHPEPTQGVENEGIKEDYSFHQHGALLYTGGYGRSFFDDVPVFLWAARGTRYQVPAEGIEAFARYALDSSMWCIYENYYDPSCRGREIARPERRPMELPLALLVLANLEQPRRAEAIGAVKEFHRFNSSYQLRTAALWKAIEDAPVTASSPVGHKHFWQSDYTVHREPGYFASLRMFSSRTRPAECIHMEGKTSWHQSNGLLWVFLRGGDYASNNVLPTLDWLRLPGTTVERRHLEPAEGFEGWPPPLGKRAFVGAAFTPKRGVSAMDLAAMVPPLTARKSWFFFGDEIVALGSDVDCPTDDATETTVNQWPLSEPGAPLTVDGQVKPTTLPWSEDLPTPRWAHCDGIGYYFPEPQTLRARRAEQRGSWRLLVEGGRDTEYSHPFLTLWYDHGKGAKGGRYAYVLLPRKTAAETETYAAAPPITVIAHSTTTHAVRHAGRNAVGIVFWAAGTVDRVSVDRPCIIYCEENAQGLALAVSDPTHAPSTSHVTIDAPLTATQLPSEATAEVVDGKTLVTCHLEKGRNYLAHFAWGG
jgi:hyaluronate lyase